MPRQRPENRWTSNGQMPTILVMLGASRVVGGPHSYLTHTQGPIEVIIDDRLAALTDARQSI